MPGPPLVTGATGFAGSHLIEHLLHFEPRVAAWSNPAGHTPQDSRADRVVWRAVDVLDRLSVVQSLDELQPSVIFHCAGAADVAASWAAPERALRVNVLGSHNLLEGLRNTSAGCPILMIGSATVYRPSSEAISENHPIGPSSPYGVSKVAQEMLAARAPGAGVFIARPFNHAGPRQSTAYVTSSFARQIAEIEAGRVEPVLRVGNLDARRDITDVRDTVRAYRLLVDRGRPRRPYNVCSGIAYRIGDLLEILIGMSHTRITVQLDPSRLRPSDNPIIAGDHSRLSEETGWQPEIPIERTLGDLLAYWRREAAGAPPGHEG